ncbi:MAG TPA: hypothetical protein VLJ86_12115, partial [Ramlibacter sp.]|nr:hypothetical protein [Ramlibacter sp.]
SMTTHAAPNCDYEAFRDAMAYGRDAEFDQLLAACRQAGRWPERDDGASLLHLAPHVGGRKAGAYTRALLAAGLSPHTVTRDRNDPVSPLGMAVRFDCAPCVEALLAAGADVGLRGPDDETMLHAAGADTAPLLIAAGLSPMARDRHGNVPLHRAWHADLLAAGVNVTNDAGLTPLHTAALADSLWRVDALLAAGADPSKRTTRDTHWRLSGMSRAFGPGLEVPKGSNAFDLARARYKASRWSTQTHEATMRRLEAVTPKRGWFNF